MKDLIYLFKKKHRLINIIRFENFSKIVKYFQFYYLKKLISRKFIIPKAEINNIETWKFFILIVLQILR